jgi:hypothetical protein
MAQASGLKYASVAEKRMEEGGAASVNPLHSRDKSDGEKAG